MIQRLPKPSLLLVGSIDFASEAWQEIERLCHVFQYSSGDRTHFLSECQAGAFEGITAVCRSNQYNYLTGDFDDQLLEHLPESVEAICNIGAGVNTIDVAACTRRSITVANTPSVGSDAVADATIFLLLGALRRATGPISRVKQGLWQQGSAIGLDAQGRTLGLYGFGAISSAVAKRATAFGMKVQYYSRTAERNGYHTPPEHVEAGYRCVSFDELIRTSDIISIHAPLTKATHHAFSTPQFEQMKKGVVIVNTARGPLVDQKALIEAVEKEIVWAAGMDVFEEEPKVPDAIRHDERFINMPHIATKTVGARTEMEVCMISNLVAALSGDKLPNAVNA